MYMLVNHATVLNNGGKWNVKREFIVYGELFYKYHFYILVNFGVFFYCVCGCFTWDLAYIAN